MDLKRTLKRRALRSRLRVLDADSVKAVRHFQTAISLHCHTQHSRETFDFIPHHAAQIPIVRQMFRIEMKRYEARHGRPIDFTRAWWAPPVTARAVFEGETGQIARRLGMRALVSITDHDEIEGCSLLQVLNLPEAVPISMEWTVPYGVGYFHIGVHNLPPDQAPGLARALIAYTRQPQGNELADLFALLNELPGVLLVLNHPHWGIECIGRERHEAALKNFLSEYSHRIHAFEVNGFRFWHENEETILMANELAFSIISGGDRHGCQANTTLNLTGAASFEEFAAEVRDGASEVLVLPDYSEPMAARMLEAAAETLREYPHYPENQRRWTDRVFVQAEDGEVQSLSCLWENGGPVWARAAVRMTCLLGSPRFRPALRLALSSEEVLS